MAVPKGRVIVRRTFMGTLLWLLVAAIMLGCMMFYTEISATIGLRQATPQFPITGNSDIEVHYPDTIPPMRTSEVTTGSKSSTSETPESLDWSSPVVVPSTAESSDNNVKHEVKVDTTSNVESVSNDEAGTLPSVQEVAKGVDEPSSKIQEAHQSSSVTVASHPNIRGSLQSFQKRDCYKRLTTKGIHGVPKQNPIATFIVTPKPLAGESEVSEQHIRHIMYGWSQVPDVNFIVFTKDCRLIDYAREYNLLTLTESSGSDVEDMTYQYMFLTVHKYNLGAPFAGFVNADVAFDASLPKTLKMLKKYNESKNTVCNVVGKRANSDVPMELFTPMDQSVSQANWDKVWDFMMNNNEPYIATSQDYFIFSTESEIVLEKLKKLPAMFVGGAGFDNYFTVVLKQMEIEEGIAAFDASRSIRAMHINHHKDLAKSHSNTASELNRMLFKKLQWGFNPTSKVKSFGSLAELSWKVVIENGEPVVARGTWGR